MGSKAALVFGLIWPRRALAPFDLYFTAKRTAVPTTRAISTSVMAIVVAVLIPVQENNFIQYLHHFVKTVLIVNLIHINKDSNIALVTIMYMANIKKISKKL